MGRTTLGIKKLGASVLWRPAEVVVEEDMKKMRRLSDQLRPLVRAVQGYAIALPQVGVSKRAFCDIYRDYRFLINPSIIESSGSIILEEGCLSIPNLFVYLDRPREVLLRAEDLDGNIVEVEASGLQARIFQHELDHLDGLTVFDRMVPEQIEKYQEFFKERPALLVQ